MNLHLSRRTLLKTGCAAVATASLPMRATAHERRFEPQVGAWRTFEIVTMVNVADAQGTTRVWLPVPDLDTDFQRTLENSWTGNASSARLVSDPERDARMLVAEFPAMAQYERSISVAVNADYARMPHAVNDGDEVAFLPPVSGG